MTEIQKIRFLAANFSFLQGLKTIPLGLLLIVVVIWANAQHGPASDLTLPLTVAIGAFGLFWLINRYYRNKYGKVHNTSRQKWFEYSFGIIGGILALAAFVLDTKYDLPFSLIGLLFALAIPAEYVRMNLLVQGHYLLPQTLISFVVVFVASILPVLGLDNWWLAIGLRAQLYGVLVVAGVITLLSGLWTHLFLARQLGQEIGS